MTFVQTRPGLVLCAALLAAVLASGAQAVEGAKSLYLLGKRGPLAGLIPKPGWYLTNDVYYLELTYKQHLRGARLSGSSVTTTSS
ncbi:MAG: hypothetical protein U9R74_06395 [Pseudomonadota bacterium]|nr:hypothetical protein [Pseudomonadota bacterium]